MKARKYTPRDIELFQFQHQKVSSELKQNNNHKFYDSITNCLTTSRRAGSLSVDQEIVRVLWYPKFHFFVRKGPSLVLILCQNHLILIFQLTRRLQSGDCVICRYFTATSC